MKVVFYIGHHKVGSTALQVLLSQNWLRLARHGILYPSVETMGFSSNLKRMLDAGDRPAMMHVNIREPHSALAYRMIRDASPRQIPGQFKMLPASAQMFQALRNQIRFLQPKAVILCSEAFSNFGEVDPLLVKQLCDVFPDASFEVYSALRRPDDYMVSWHGQRLKVGERLEPLQGQGTRLYYHTIHFDYRKVVEAWARHVPNVRLIVRNYKDIVAAGGSTSDFTEQVGIDFPEDMIPAGRVNKSLPRAAMEIVRQGNWELAPEDGRALSDYFLKTDDSLNLHRNGDIEMYGTDIRAEIVERFAPFHDYLGELTGQSAFFPDFDEMARPLPIPERTAVAHLLSQIDPETLPNDRTREFIGKMHRDYAA